MNDTTGCERVEQRLADALAVGRPGDADVVVQDHLAACSRCRRYEARLRKLMDTLYEDPVPDPGDSYWEQFAARVEKRVETRPRRRWPLWSGLAAAAALILFLVYLPGPSTESDLPATSLAVDADGDAGPTGEEQVEDLRCLLNELLGPVEGLDLSGESWDLTDWDLTDEEQRALLERLRTEIDNPA